MLINIAENALSFYTDLIESTLSPDTIPILSNRKQKERGTDSLTPICVNYG